MLHPMNAAAAAAYLQLLLVLNCQLCVFVACVQVELHGPADPLRMLPSGCVTLDSGTLNLVATQFTLDREHVNRILFLPEAGPDPYVDVVLTSGDLRAAVQGRGSTWQDGLTLSASGTTLVGAGAGSVGVIGGGGPGVGVSSGGGVVVSGGRGSRGGPVGVGSPGGSDLGLGPPTLMEPPEVARVFEERLAEALLGE